MKYNYASKSAIGGRKENQDSAGSMQTPFGFAAVVCDGMGGLAGGKVASSMAVDIILHELSSTRYADPASALRAAIVKANHEIYRRGRHHQELRGMSTTAIAVIINVDKAIVAHVGDSRVYQLREGEKVFRTNDHSKVFELVKRGILTEEQARLSEESNVIQRALGIASDVDVEINDNIAFWKGDLFMLCSDGVCGAISEAELLDLLSRNDDVEKLTHQIIQEIDLTGIRQGGGHDNLTVSFVQPLIDSKLKVSIDMKTRILMNVFSIWVALLTIALGYVIFSGSVRLQGGSSQNIDSLAEGLSALSKDFKELRTTLESQGQPTAPITPEAESPANANTAQHRQPLRPSNQNDSSRRQDPSQQAIDSTQFSVVTNYMVRKGDTNETIGKDLGIHGSAALRKFREANKHITWTNLQEGQVLDSINVPKGS